MVIRDVDDQRRCGIVHQNLAEDITMSAGFLIPVSVVDIHQLASVIRNRIENVLIIDSRSFIEHNACHISSAVNVCCSKIVKRRLQQDKLSVKELLMHTCHYDVDEKLDVVVYDQSSKDVDCLPADSFTVILLKKLQLTFRSVNLLTGGFDEFQKYYPDLCEDKTRKCPPLTSLSQPCLPIANQGPTRILPFLYLGSQFDALNKELLKDHNITYELNVSTTCPQPEFVQEGHFMRIPVNDTYSEKLLPYFPDAFNFLDKVREGSGCVLVHCLAGISRSPTVAIAYVMRYLRLSSDDGYRYVKSKRPTISPNFNFLGQLLEYEKQLRRENILEAKPEVMSAPPLCNKKRLCRTDMRTSKLSLDIDPKKNESSNIFLQSHSGDQSPTTALAKLSFEVQQVSSSDETSQSTHNSFKQYRSKSCYGEWLRDRDETIVERKPRDCNAATTSKVLSPVKEIKCDGLISEISTGKSEVSVKSRGNIRHWKNSPHSGEERHNYIPQSCVDKHSGSSDREERFSLQTLSHLSSSSNPDYLEISKSRDSRRINVRSNPSKLIEIEKFQSSSEVKRSAEINQPCLTETGNKRLHHISLDRSRELTPKKEKIESHFVFSEHTAPQYKTSSLHPFSFNSDSYTRSGSAGTSGFGSESSDYNDNNTETGKRSDSFKLDIDIEDLEDDVISKIRGARSKICTEEANNDRTFFPLPLPDVASSEWSGNLESPLSPSESHLLEDLEMEKDISCSKTEPSTPSGASFPSEDPDSFHDSGVPLSPPWIWPRKRVANFDTTCANTSSGSSTRDKRKYEPFPESISSSVMKDKRLWLTETDKYFTKTETLSTSHTYHSSVADDKIGLYRVQSWPGYLCHESSFCTSRGQLEEFSLQKKYFGKDAFMSSMCTETQYKEIICHESCPDVLHLEEIESSLDTMSHRQRDFRRNVRMIQVS